MYEFHGRHFCYNLLPFKVQYKNNLVCDLEGKDCVGNTKQKNPSLSLLPNDFPGNVAGLNLCFATSLLNYFTGATFKLCWSLKTIFI